MTALFPSPSTMSSSASPLPVYEYDFYDPPVLSAAVSSAAAPRVGSEPHNSSNGDPDPDPPRLVNNFIINRNVKQTMGLPMPMMPTPRHGPNGSNIAIPPESSSSFLTTANANAIANSNTNFPKNSLSCDPSTSTPTLPSIATSAGIGTSTKATTTVLAKPPASTNRVLSSFMPPPPVSSSYYRRLSLLSLLASSPLLAALLNHLPWSSAHSLLNTCKTTRYSLFSDLTLRDVVLARYVPGYRYAMRVRDLRFFQDVKVSLGDLDLLLLSQKYPLHHYPTHALRILSSLYPSLEDDAKTAKLIALTHAHSRFVLLLQSLVHSGSELLGEEGDVEDVERKLERRERQTKLRAARPRSRFAPTPASAPAQTQALRELTFPAPLAYTQPQRQIRSEEIALLSSSAAKSQKGLGTLRSKSKPATSTTTSRHKHSQSLSQPMVMTIITSGEDDNQHDEFGLSTLKLGSTKSNVGGLGGAATYTGPSASRLSSMMMSTDSKANDTGAINARNGRRLSIFSKNPPPPPPEEPKTLKIYASSWRRSRRRIKDRERERGRDSMSVDFGRLGVGADEEEDMLMMPVPMRGFAMNDASSDSSMSATASAPPSIAGRDTPISSSFHGSGSGSGSGFGSGFGSASGSGSGSGSGFSSGSGLGYSTSSHASHASTTSTSSNSPHDLSLATRRMRAPILRVFVPCSRLDDGGANVNANANGDGDGDENDYDIDSESIVQCEKQLEEAGLWAHLSTGDVVCNLGYIPPSTAGSGGGGGGANGDDTSFEDEMRTMPMLRLHGHGGSAGGSSSSDAYSSRGSYWGRGGGGGSNVQYQQHQYQVQPQVKWLLFDGRVLVPYSPPDLLPLDDPLSLPSPFYYAHITPPSSPLHPHPPSNMHAHFTSQFLHPHANFNNASPSKVTPPPPPPAAKTTTTNPTFVIARLPLCDDVPQLRLVHTTGKVPSPHSPSGYALVRRWAWTARVVRVRRSVSGGGHLVGGGGGGGLEGVGMGVIAETGGGGGVGTEGSLGEGWYGEWVLEYEGTKEGKQVLLRALAGKVLGRRVWELVREKCVPGRIWLRLLPS